MAANAIGSLIIDLRADSATFSRDLSKSSKKLHSFSAKSNRVLGAMDKGFGKAARSAAGFAATLTPMGGLLAGGLVVGLVAATKRAVQFADSIGKVADKVGLSTDALQEMRFAAEQSGVNTTTLDMAMQRFSRRLGEVAQGQGELLGVAKQYNVAVRDGEGRMRSNIDILGDFADVIKNAESEQERLRIAFKLFDSEGAALVNLMRRGSGAIEDFAAQARKAGIVLSEEMVRGAEDSANELNLLNKVIETDMTRALLGLAPLLTWVTGFFADIGTTVRWLSDQWSTTALEDYKDKLADLNSKIAENISMMADSSMHQVVVSQLRFQTDLLIKKAEALEENIKKIEALKKAQAAPLNKAPPVAGALPALPKNLKTGPAPGSFRAAQDTGMKDVINAEIAAWTRLGEKRREIRIAVAASTQGMILENVQRRQMIAATFQGTAAVAELTKAIELENEATRLGVDFSTQKGQAWAEEFRQGQQLTEQLGNVTTAQEEQAAATVKAMATVAASVDSVSESIARGATDVLLYGKSWDEVGKNFTRNFIDAAVSGLIKIAAQMAINFAISQVFGKAAVVSAVAEGAAVAAAWAPAAAAMSLATAGANALPATAGIISTNAVSRGLASFKDGGSWMVGGAGGIDSQLVAFNASPNERVTVETPAQQRGMRGVESAARDDARPVIVQFQIVANDTQGFDELLQSRRAMITNIVKEAVADSGRRLGI